MIFGIDTFLDKLSQQIDRITQMYVDPEKPYDSPKIIRVSLETIKQKFFHELSRAYEILVNIESITRKPSQIFDDLLNPTISQINSNLESFQNLTINASSLIDHTNNGLQDLLQSLMNGSFINNIDVSEISEKLHSLIENLNSSITNSTQFIQNEYATRNLKEEFKKEIANANNLLETLNYYTPILMCAATVFLVISSVSVAACAASRCIEAWRKPSKIDINSAELIQLLNKSHHPRDNSSI